MKFKTHSDRLNLRPGEFVVVMYNDKEQIACVEKVETRPDDTRVGPIGDLVGIQIYHQRSITAWEPSKVHRDYDEGWLVRLGDYIFDTQRWLDSLQSLLKSKN